MLAPALLVAAATVRVVFAPFLVDRAPGILSNYLPTFYAAAIKQSQCALATAPGQLGPQTLADFAECTDRNACLGDVGRGLGAQFVVRGLVTKTDTQYLIQLTVFDVHEYRVSKHLEHHYEGKLNGLGATVKEHIADLCTTLNPDWKDPATQTAFDTLAFDPPTPEATPAPTITAAPAPPPAARFDELPPMIDPPPPVVAPAAIKPVDRPPPVVRRPPVSSAPPVIVQLQPRTAAPVVNRALAPALAPGPPVPRRPAPVAAIVSGGALVLTAIGIGFGAESNALWSSDTVKTVNGIHEHSIPHNEALTANRDAGTADVFFGLAGATAVAAGVVVYFRGGLGVGGHF